MSRIKVNKVLIDGGAAISLLPERMLMKVGKHPDDLVPTNIAVTDFSGTSTPAKGLVTLGVRVRFSDRNTIFVVVPLKASYNALLGGTRFTGLEQYHLLCIRVSFFGQKMENLKLLRLIRICMLNNYMLISECIVQN
ncbi:hypothetical protein Ahy_A01g000165 [Arachis hypogaea]|uniref:Peptidase A2 domain-containing protein n=1 Tax=Arachis hypogaea TaxID=3818 RepID=A0A445EJL8_ARAHY|nr:hypothetical protein Ahy_A01g000165 [Arachis hypogaea]